MLYNELYNQKYYTNTFYYEMEKTDLTIDLELLSETANNDLNTLKKDLDFSGEEKKIYWILIKGKFF